MQRRPAIVRSNHSPLNSPTGKKVNSTVSSGGSTSTMTRRKPRPAWNDYLTDGDRYKLDNEKILMKKKQMVSSNNILVEGNDIKVFRARIPLRSKSAHAAKSADDTNQNRSKWTIESHDVKKTNRQLTRRSASLCAKASKKRALKSEREDEMDSLDLVILDDHPTGATGGKDNRSANRITHKTAVTERRQAAERRYSSSPSTHHMQLNNRPTRSRDTPTPRRAASSAAVALDISDDDSFLSRLRADSDNESNAVRFATPTSRKEPVATPSTAKKTARRGPSDAIPLGSDAELDEITAEIRSLHAELKYFEELSGKKSILDAEVRVTHAPTMFPLSCHPY